MHEKLETFTGRFCARMRSLGTTPYFECCKICCQQTLPGKVLSLPKNEELEEKLSVSHKTSVKTLRKSDLVEISFLQPKSFAC